MFNNTEATEHIAYPELTLFEFESIKKANWYVSYHSIREWSKLYFCFIKLSGYTKLPQMMKM